MTEPHREHFEEATRSIGAPDGSTGLLGTAADLAAPNGSTEGVDEIVQRYADYLAVHDAVPQLDDAASYNRAVELLVTDEADAADRLDEALRNEIAAARERLDDNAADAHRRFRGLAAAVAAAAVLAAVLAVVGLQRRIREYR